MGPEDRAVSFDGRQLEFTPVSSDLGGRRGCRGGELHGAVGDEQEENTACDTGIWLIQKVVQ